MSNSNNFSFISKTLMNFSSLKDEFNKKKNELNGKIEYEILVDIHKKAKNIQKYLQKNVDQLKKMGEKKKDVVNDLDKTLKN